MTSLWHFMCLFRSLCREKLLSQVLHRNLLGSLSHLNKSKLYKNIKCLYLDFIPNRWEFFRFRSGHIKCQWVLESVASVNKFQRCVHRYAELKIFSI